MATIHTHDQVMDRTDLHWVYISSSMSSKAYTSHRRKITYHGGGHLPPGMPAKSFRGGLGGFGDSQSATATSNQSKDGICSRCSNNNENHGDLRGSHNWNQPQRRWQHQWPSKQPSRNIEAQEAEWLSTSRSWCKICNFFSPPIPSVHKRTFVQCWNGVAAALRLFIDV